MDRFELKEKRERLRLTQAEVADLLGVKENTVYRWEAGRVPISKMVELSFESIERKLQNGNKFVDQPT